MKFEDGGELWLIQTDEYGQQWLVHNETQQRVMWAGQCWPRVLHYGPGGERLPDGQPRIRMEPQGFVARFLYAWRAARSKG